MPKTMRATCVKLSPETRKLFSLMNFPVEIPDEANYICFYEDGDAGFLEEITTVYPHGVFPMPMVPKIAIAMYYTDVLVEYED